jgi:NTP pyrophosphatase (non-canonical NTP hydrolase)
MADKTQGSTPPEKWMDTCANFIEAWDRMKDEAGSTAKRHGFREGYEVDDEKSFGLKNALMHSELSEALEAARRGNPMSVKIPPCSHISEEFADCVIRIMDEADRLGLDVARAIVLKMAFNDKREYKHGKAF